MNWNLANIKLTQIAIVLFESLRQGLIDKYDE